MTDVPYSKVTVIVETGEERTITLVPYVEQVNQAWETYPLEEVAPTQARNPGIPIIKSLTFDLQRLQPNPNTGISYFFAESVGVEEDDITQTIYLSLVNAELDVLKNQGDIAIVAKALAKELVAMGLNVVPSKLAEIQQARPSTPPETKTYIRRLEGIKLQQVLEGLVPSLAVELENQLKEDIPYGVDGSFEAHTEYKSNNDDYTLIVEWTPKVLSTLNKKKY